MRFIAENQILLLLLFFAAGAAGTLRLWRKPAGHRAWRVADLTWVILGGLGAVAAVVAGIHTADTSRLGRQIDIAYAAIQSFDRDAARFRLRFCDPAYEADIATLCDKVDFLSASTAKGAQIDLFIEVTDQVAPLSRLFLRRDMPAKTAAPSMPDGFDPNFNPQTFVTFTALDAPTEAAVTAMRRKVPTIAADFLILARSYDDLITQITRLKAEYDTLQANTYLLALQVLALCLVSFAAPFRLGKSIVDLRG